jgi:hypothetical protein
LAGHFDVFITVDRGIAFQQNIVGRPFAVVLLRTHSNRLVDLLPLVPAVTQALETVQAGAVVHIGA